MNTYETVVGMEIHVELKTVSKMFCGCKNDPFHAPKPNIYTCPVCLGMPGALPVPNKKAIESTILLGLALGSDIAEFSKFDRKNYFYPDIPKGYQISQYDQPLCRGGLIQTEFGDVRIHRVHLEEDTGKLQHTTLDGKKVSLVDFNRSGVPLVEIVTEADIRTGDQAKAFLKKLHAIIQNVGISDADMEKGTMRIEPNISVRLTGETKLPTYKVEVKNINSFNYVKRAIEFETKRHIELLEKGQTPIQETRGWNEDKNISVSQRRKETADDYRYFPDPDLPPIRWSREAIEALKSKLPQSPDEKKQLLVDKGVSVAAADVLVANMDKMKLFDSLVSDSGIREAKLSLATIANFVVNKVPDAHSAVATDIVRQLVAVSQTSTMDEAALKELIAPILVENEKAVADYKAGKAQSLMFLLGLVMRKTAGKAQASQVKTMLEAMLK